MATCYVVATPIGNLADLSPRAREVLASVATIYAEDTRVTAHLLTQFGLRVPLVSLHEHNEMERIEPMKAQLERGESVAIVSDAGTPLISDPGFPVVAALREAGFSIIPIPGPSALITALSVSGIPTDRFTFEGFLPPKSGARLNRLEKLSEKSETLIFYESSHRILAMLESAIEAFGADREAFIGREMTKHFESYQQGELSSLLEYFLNHKDEIRGEFVVIIRGKNRTDEPSDEHSVNHLSLLNILLDEGLPQKQIVSIAQKVTGLPKNQLYQTILSLKNGREEQ